MSAPAIQPDLVFTLDFSGVIQSAAISGELAEAHESATPIDALVGQSWRDTCDASNAGKVDRIVQGAVQHEVCGFSQINQRLPSGQTVLFEFIAVQTRWKQQRIVVVGKNLTAVVKMQDRLLSTQRSMEKEFWKLREMETRYSTLVNATPDVVLVLRDPDLRVVDINEHASKAIDIATGDSISRLALSDTDSEKLRNTLDTARQSGRAPVIVIRCGPQNNSWRLRASSYTGQSGLQFMLQFSIHHTMAKPANVEPISGISAADIVDNLPEGLVAINQQNFITHVNPAFAKLINRTSTDTILGQSFDRWLPPARTNDVETLRSILSTEDPVYNFPSCLLSEDSDGTQNKRDVLLSARRLPGDHPELMLMLIRSAAA
jgi:transcriptional regulator PpsR